jgi:hypothetical protein
MRMRSTAPVAAWIGSTSSDPDLPAWGKNLLAPDTMASRTLQPKEKEALIDC